MKHLLAFFVIAILSVACLPIKYTPESSTIYTNHPKTNQTTVIHPVYIDPSFKSETKEQIVLGFEEWNVVLNGYSKFIINESKPNQILSPFDFIVVNITSSEADDEGIPGGVLGWVDDLGDPVIHLVEDRMRDQNIKILLMHEAGHSLGMPHLMVKGTLMFPYYPNSPCVTKTDVRELASINKNLSLEHLNWCNFELN